MRLFGTGFENQAAEGFETITGGSIESASPLSGLYSDRYNGFASAAQGKVKRFASAGVNVTYHRFRIKVVALPDIDNIIFKVQGSTGLSAITQGAIILRSTGVLRARHGSTTIAVDSPSVNDGLEHIVELLMDASPASGSRILTARLDGVQFATASTGVFSSPFYQAWGGGLGAEAVTAGDWIFDDIAVNDNSGSFDNTWIGDSRFRHVRPSGAGSINDWLQGAGGTAGSVNNWARVDEEQADDATTYNQKDTSKTGAQQDLFVIGHPVTVAGIPSGSTIKTIQVGGKIGNLTNTAQAGRDMKWSLLDSIGQTDSAIVPTALNGWAFHQVGAPNVYPLTMPKRSDGAAWDLTELAGIQIGYREGTQGVTGASRVTQLWALVEYVPPPSTTPIVGTDTGSGADSGAITGKKGADTGSGVESGSVVASGGPPVNTGAPAITGYPVVGRVLNVSDGTWSGTPTSFTYQWQRADNIGFTQNVVSIGGATSNSYTPVSADRQKYLRCVVTAVNGGGSTPANSNVVGLVGWQMNSALDGHTAVCGNITLIFVPGTGRPAGNETGHGTDTGQLTTSISTYPGALGQGIGGDTASIKVSPSSSDSGTSTESASVNIAALPIHVSDQAQGADRGELSGTTPVPPPTPIVEPGPAPEPSPEEQFVCGEFGLAVFNELSPLAYADEQNDNALHTFTCALGSMFEEIWQLARDKIINGKQYPGWSSIVDLNRAPTKYLPWLAQFIGVTIPRGYTDAQQRDFIKRADGFRRGTIGSIIGAARQHLTGNKTVIFRERFTNAYHLLVITRTFETPDQNEVLAAILEQKPGGIVLEYHVVRGRTWLEVRDENANWLAARSAYSDWETMRATRDIDVPSTTPLVPADNLMPGGLLAPGG